MSMIGISFIIIIINIILICLNSLDVSERVKNIEALKLKLYYYMDNEDWEAVFKNHIYFKSPTIDYVVYYVCNYLIRQLSERYVCERCL